MPRYIFPASTVTNTTGAAVPLAFYATSTTGRRETDLWTVDGSSSLLERIPNGIILADVTTGAYSAFAGPDDVDTLYLSANGGARTAITATTLVTGQGGTYLTATFAKTWTSPAASTTLTGTLAAWVITSVDCTAGAGARALPAASSVTAGTSVCAKKADTSANNLVVSRAGSDLIYGTGAGSTSKTLSLSGEAVEFVSNGVDKWTIRASDTPSGVLATTYAALRAPRRAASLLRGTAAANESGYYTSAFTNVPTTNSVKRYTAYRSTSGVRLVYGNANSIETNTGLVQITVRAAVDDGTTKIPVYFGGKRDVAIDVGGIAVSDPVAITLAAAQTFYARTFVTASDTLHIPYMGSEAVTYSAWGEGCDASNGVTATDKTLSGTVTANNVSHYSPMVITCADDGTGPLVSLNGDSIMSGVGEVSPFVAAGRGFARRALNNTIPYVMSATAGSKLADPRVLRRPLITACSDALCNSGINDLGAGSSLATIQANMLAEWTWHSNLGARVWQCTILPKTTSTDTWATVGNQTAVSFNASRTGLNDWIRAGAPTVNGVAVAVGTSNAVVAGQTGHPLKGYFETADVVETARNSGIWTPAYVYTTDTLGVHPNSAGHAALAAAIDTLRFV